LGCSWCYGKLIGPGGGGQPPSSHGGSPMHSVHNSPHVSRPPSPKVPTPPRPASPVTPPGVKTPPTTGVPPGGPFGGGTPPHPSGSRPPHSTPSTPGTPPPKKKTNSSGSQTADEEWKVRTGDKWKVYYKLLTGINVQLARAKTDGIYTMVKDLKNVGGLHKVAGLINNMKSVDLFIPSSGIGYFPSQKAYITNQFRVLNAYYEMFTGNVFDWNTFDKSTFGLQFE